MAWAKGRFSKAICDRCGFKFDYLDLKRETTGFRVCTACLDDPFSLTSHPQLRPPKRLAEAVGLEHARPDIPNPTTVSPWVPPWQGPFFTDQTFFSDNTHFRDTPFFGTPLD